MQMIVEITDLTSKGIWEIKRQTQCRYLTLVPISIPPHRLGNLKSNCDILHKCEGKR